MIQDDVSHLRSILNTGESLQAYLSDYRIGEKEILEDHIVQWTITTPLYNIGEHVYHLSDEPKNTHPAIPWLRIAGIRHRLVHNYAGTNWSIVAETVLSSLPDLLEHVKIIISEEAL